MLQLLSLHICISCPHGKLHQWSSTSNQTNFGFELFVISPSFFTYISCKHTFRVLLVTSLISTNPSPLKSYWGHLFIPPSITQPKISSYEHPDKIGASGHVVSFEYVYVFTLLAFPASSHAITFNVVVALNDWLLHTLLLQFGVLPSVVYLTVQSLLVVLQLTLVVFPLKHALFGVHVGFDGAVVSTVKLLTLLHSHRFHNPSFALTFQ